MCFGLGGKLGGNANREREGEEVEDGIGAGAWEHGVGVYGHAAHGEGACGGGGCVCQFV